MYEIFYNLQAEPFRLSPDHRFCYEHRGYAKARAYMAYAFMRAEGFVVITGRPGTGKTTLIGDLLESLAKDNVTTANLVCTQLQADDLLKTVAYSFGVSAGDVDKAELLQRLKVLFHNWHRDGRRALLIVDEAQDLSTTAIEELRLLTNIQVDGQPLLQIFLLGQPELRDLILSPAMEQVHQRIVAASHLEALELEETEAYVLHRLEAVGWQGDPAISKAIFPLIYKFSEGVPRRINLICSRLFLHGGVEQRHEIGVQDVRVVISELQGENLAAGSKFSEDDFAVEDEFEQITSVAEPSVVQAPVEVRIHAVSNESFAGLDSAQAKARSSPPPKGIPVVTEVPQSFSAGISVERIAPVSHSGSGDDQDGAAMPEKQTEVQAIAHVHSGSAENGLRRSAGQPVKRRAPGRGASAILVILVISLFVFLGFFAARQSVWDDWQSKWQALWGELTVPLSTPAVRDMDIGQVQELVEIAEPIMRAKPEDGIRDDAPVVGPMEFESGEELQAPEATGAGEFAIGSPPEAELPASDESAVPVELPAQDDGRQPLEEISLPENDQVLFVAFAFDSVNLPPASREALDHVVKAMSQSRSRVASITGFSDNQGDEAYNLELSRQRASAVEQYLVGKGIKRERLQVEGRGAFYDFTDAEIYAAGLESEEYRIVKIRVSSGPGSTDI